MKIFYKTRATATGGRSGRTALDDDSLALDLAIPGSGKTGANPEQLFALGYAACFDNALVLVAKQLKLEPAGSKTSVEVGIGQTPEGGYALDIDLYVEL
ncbi:MAG: Ohr family peroxiredoxin, partial [Acidobacteriaceae bacterium]